QCSGPDVSDGRGEGIEGELHLTTEKVVQHQPRAAIGYMYHAHAGLARHMGPGPAFGRRHIELVRIGLSVGDEFETRRYRNRRMHLHDQSGAADTSDGCNVTEEIEREILEEGRVDRAAGRDHDERIAVWR